jgi:hypothetical protein
MMYLKNRMIDYFWFIYLVYNNLYKLKIDKLDKWIKVLYWVC